MNLRYNRYWIYRDMLMRRRWYWVFRDMRIGGEPDEVKHIDAGYCLDKPIGEMT